MHIDLSPILRVALSFALVMTVSPFCGTQAFASEANVSSENSEEVSSESDSSCSNAAVNPEDLTWDTCGSCEWAVDGNKTLIIRPKDGIEGTLNDERPWYKNYFVSVSFEGKVNSPKRCRMLEGCRFLESVNLTGLDTSSVEDMSSMFNGCSSLESIDLSGLDTSSVEDMSSMFNGCSSLESLDLSEFDVSSITGTSEMFAGCSSLELVKVPEGFPLAKALPSSCHWLSSVDGIIYQSDAVPSGPAATYTRIEPGSAGRVFRCGTCEWLVDGEGTLVISPVDGATSGELGDWSPDQKTSTGRPDARSPWAGLPIVSARFEGHVVAPTAIGMFYRCSSLKSIDLSGLDTSSAKDMSYMFAGCSSLESIDLSGLDSSSVTDVSDMFSDCSGLRSLNLSVIDLSRVYNMSGAFYGCISLEDLDLPRLDSQSLRYLTSTFRRCSSLKTLDLSGVNAPFLSNLNWTFGDCTSLQSIDFTSSYFSRMESMSYTFYNCSSLQHLDLLSFDTSKVTDMSYAFDGCRGLKDLDLSVLDTSCVSSVRRMLANCDSLQSLALPNTYKGEMYTSSMFYFTCDESFRLTVGSNFDTYDAAINGYASLPGVRSTGHYLDRIVTGRWINVETGEVLSTREIPSRVAATYAPEVVYRDMGASVRVQGDRCPAERLLAEVVFDNDASDSDINLFYQWFDASSDQPVSEGPFFQVTENDIGREYYCIVTDSQEGDRNELRSDTITADHTLGEEWEYGGQGHWRACTACGKAMNVSDHIFGDWKIDKRPFAGIPGRREHTCSVCGFIESESFEGDKLIESPFTDVLVDSTPHYEEIMRIAEYGVTTGFPDGTFRPYASIARCDMAAFLYRLADSPDYEVTDADIAAFADVDVDTPHYKEICWLVSMGISTGFPDGTFRPYASVTRCDMAAFLQRLGERLGTPSYVYPMGFADVDNNTPHADAIEWLSKADIAHGFLDGARYCFRPYENVTRCDMAAFLYRLKFNCR